jgi:hypothetical protein
VSVLLDVDGILALMREQGERDLAIVAIVAIVATMADSEDEAIERLQEIEDTMREYKQTLSYRKDRLAFKTAQGVVEMAPRLRGIITQLRDRRVAA